MMKKILIALFILILMQIPSFADEISFYEAKTFFDTFVKYGHEYNNAIVNMYSDTAFIKRNVKSNGKYHEVIIPAKNYKQKLLRLSIAARLTGYRNDFYNVKYVKEGKNIRINATRKRNQHYYPISFLLEKNDKGKILIKEEIADTQDSKIIKLIKPF